MSSEIPNVLKLSPVTVVKTANKQSEDQGSSGLADEAAFRASVASLPQGDQQVSADRSKEGGAVGSQNGKSKVSPELVKKAVDEGNGLLQMTKRNLQFKVDDDTKEMVVKIVDSESGKVVRQIPSEEMLEFVKSMQEMEGQQQGIVFKDRA